MAAWADLDLLSRLSLLCLIIAWFFADTLVVTLGTIKHGVRFFDIAALIADPTRMFLGIDVTLQTVSFAALCGCCLLLPLWPHLLRQRWAWLAYFAPLILLVTCAALLYSRTSAEFFTSTMDAGSVGGKVLRFANSLVHRGGDLVARHVSVGVGGYLAALASAVLAVRGVHRFHTHYSTAPRA